MFICGLHERARCMRENMFYPGFLSQGFIKWTLFFIVPITPLHTQHFWDIVQTCPWNIRIIQIYNSGWKRVFITVNITFMNRIYHKFVVIFTCFPMFPFKLAHIVQDFNHENIPENHFFLMEIFLFVVKMSFVFSSNNRQYADCWQELLFVSLF